MQTLWRYIPPLVVPGAVQMALDWWLLEQHRVAGHPPTLRFYTWSPAAISLGYHQKDWPQQWHSLSWNGELLELVRRPSGGRGVLHEGDLTYALVDSRRSGSRVAVYQTLCEFLVEGWRSLGVELHYGTTGRGYIGNPSCFATATGADLVTADGYKLIGSAQLRQGSAVLQHGSMRLQPNAELEKAVFGEKAPAIELERQKFGHFDPAMIVQALSQSACECWGISLKTMPLSPEEWRQVRAIAPRFCVSP